MLVLARSSLARSPRSSISALGPHPQRFSLRDSLRSSVHTRSSLVRFASARRLAAAGGALRSG